MPSGGRETGRTLAEVTVVGPDRKGVVAAVTDFLFRNRGNIEQIRQNVVRGTFGMHLEASFAADALDKEALRAGLKKLGLQLGMRTRVHLDEPDRPKNLVILATKEPHCLEALLKEWRTGRLGAEVRCVIGTEGALAPLARKFRVPFHRVAARDLEKLEAGILALAERYNADFMALARFMRILSPAFVWRYPNRIINIHPSILPAFAGAYAYVQAYERGAQIVGCTAHFVTEELDQGPIILQGAFRVRPGAKLEEIRRQGQALEARTLVGAVKLFSQNRLEVAWGKVQFLPRAAGSLRSQSLGTGGNAWKH